MMRRRGGVVRGVARTAAVAGTASAVSGRVHHRQQEKWADQNQQDVNAAYDQGVQDAQAAPAPAEAGGGNSDVIAQLQQLGELRAQGILTNEEFEAQKAKLLGT